MSKYWSPSTLSFYDSNVCATSQMPSDKVQLTDTEYNNLMTQQAAGKRIEHNSSTGKPQAVAQNLTAATATTHEVTKATGSVLGHVTLSDSTSSTSGASAGVAATPAAVKAVADAKAPNDHSSTATTYGVGNASKYGHVKLSDSTSSTSGVSGGVAATPAAVKAVQDAVTTLDGKVVHLTGDEEIAGEKTFTTTPIVENAAPSVRCINTGLTKGTNPSALNISNSGWFDKNSKWLGFYGYQVETSGEAKSYLGVYEFDSASDSAENRATLGIAYPKNGTPHGFAPSTPSDATEDEIATAGWIQNTANAASATKLKTARTVRTNLASTSTASFDGSDNITPGVTGVLPIANGGTGSNTQNFVDLSSSQTVGGGKTWTGNQNIKKSGPVISFQNTGITKGTAPSSTQTTSITFGSNGGTNAANSLAILQNYVETDGDNVVKLAVYDPTASSSTNSGLVMTYPKGGTPTFTLGGKNIVRSVNGTNADATGNVTNFPIYNTQIQMGIAGTTVTIYAPPGGTWKFCYWYVDASGKLVAGSSLNTAGGGAWTNASSTTAVGFWIRIA